MRERRWTGLWDGLSLMISQDNPIYLDEVVLVLVTEQVIMLSHKKQVGLVRMDGVAVAGEVVTAGTALAGLILIYIGSLVTAYGSYQAVEQKSVKLRFLARAWLGFVGFLLALSSAGLAVMGKWVSNSCMGNASVWILLGAFGWAVFATIQGIREIR